MITESTPSNNNTILDMTCTEAIELINKLSSALLLAQKYNMNSSETMAASALTGKDSPKYAPGMLTLVVDGSKLR